MTLEGIGEIVGQIFGSKAGEMAGHGAGSGGHVHAPVPYAPPLPTPDNPHPAPHPGTAGPEGVPNNDDIVIHLPTGDIHIPNPFKKMGEAAGEAARSVTDGIQSGVASVEYQTVRILIFAGLAILLFVGVYGLMVGNSSNEEAQPNIVVTPRSGKGGAAVEAEEAAAV